MITKDFDAEFAATGPAEFVLCGEKFHLKEHVPYTIWRTLMRGDRKLEDDASPDEVDRALFGDLLAPEDLDRFMELSNRTGPDSPTRAQMIAVYGWAMEVASGKAQKSEETSSDGS